MNCSSMAVLYISDMLITFAIFGACCISVIKTHAGHSHNSEANEEILEEEWPSEEEKMDHLVNPLDIVSSWCYFQVCLGFWWYGPLPWSHRQRLGRISQTGGANELFEGWFWKTSLIGSTFVSGSFGRACKAKCDRKWGAWQCRIYDSRVGGKGMLWS